MVSWISEDGLNFAKEAGYRFEGYTLFGHWIVRNPDGARSGCTGSTRNRAKSTNKGYKAIKSALSTDGGWDFYRREPGERLTYSGTGYQRPNGIGREAGSSSSHDGRFRMYYGGERATDKAGS